MINANFGHKRAPLFVCAGWYISEICRATELNYPSRHKNWDQHIVTASPAGTSNSNNRFDALRLAFASFVFVYHIIALAALDVGGGAESIASRFADIGVKGFFVISGALVFGSFQRSNSLSVYFSKRIRRLVPAYMVIISLPTIAAIFFHLISGFSASGFSAVAAYFGANIIFLNFLSPELPGFFDNNRFSAVNGALWTIKIEVMFYAILPIIGVIIARLKKNHTLAFLLLLYVGGEVWRIAFASLADQEGVSLFTQMARQLPGQMAYFASGIALWMMRDEFKPHIERIGIFGAALVALSLAPYLDILRPAGIAALIAFAAWSPGPKLNVTRWGDLSYGVYITHFPIIQALVVLGAFEASPYLGAVLAIIFVFLSSLAMWRWVERPWLCKDSHYRQREAP